MENNTKYFKAKLELIGINPFVFVPDAILQQLFSDSGRNKGPIPICGTVNGKIYVQTLVKYQGSWRLYINTSMLTNSPKRIGELLEITVETDQSDRSIPLHPKLIQALQDNPDAKNVFDSLPPSRQKEIVRYLSFLKTEASVGRNVEKTIGFLLGKNRFVGRDKP